MRSLTVTLCLLAASAHAADRLRLVPDLVLGDAAPANENSGPGWRIAGTAGAALAAASVGFGVTIYGLSTIPTTGPTARNDTPALIGASALAGVLGGIGGYFLGSAAEHSTGLKVLVVALDLIGAFFAVTAVGLITGGFFSLR